MLSCHIYPRQPVNHARVIRLDRFLVPAIHFFRVVLVDGAAGLFDAGGFI